MPHILNFVPAVDVAADDAQFLISLEPFVPMLCLAEHRHNYILLQNSRQRRCLPPPFI